MGRNSLRAERQVEIVAAFAEVAAEVGLPNVTLRLVAERLDVTPPLLLHHFKNRDAIVEAFFGAVTASVGQSAAAMFQAISDDPDGEALISYLFDGAYHELISQAGSLWAELQAEMTRNRELRGAIRNSFRELEGRIATHLAQAAPDATTQERADAAHGLIALVEGAQIIDQMGFGNRPARRAKQSALVILAHLVAQSDGRTERTRS